MSSAPGERYARPLERPDGAPAVSWRVRGLVVAVWMFLLAHFAATFLWAAPGYVAGRPGDAEAASATPDSAVHRVLEPYMTSAFAQSWSIFAPSPLHVEYTLRVRGIYAASGSGTMPGPWIDTTAVEVRALTGRLLPAAIERPSRRLAGDTRAAYLALPDAARAIVLAPPASDGSVAGLPVGDGDPPANDQEDAASAVWQRLRAALLDAGAAPDAVDLYLAKDRALAAYATQVLRASGTAPGAAGTAPKGAAAVGRGPLYVQVSIERHAVTPYGTTERPQPTELVLGARPPVVLPGQDGAAFRATWDALRDDAPPAGSAP